MQRFHGQHLVTCVGLGNQEGEGGPDVPVGVGVSAMLVGVVTSAAASGMPAGAAVVAAAAGVPAGAAVAGAAVLGVGGAGGAGEI